MVGLRFLKARHLLERDCSEYGLLLKALLRNRSFAAIKEAVSRESEFSVPEGSVHRAWRQYRGGTEHPSGLHWMSPCAVVRVSQEGSGSEPAQAAGSGGGGGVGGFLPHPSFLYSFFSFSEFYSLLRTPPLRGPLRKAKTIWD